MEIFREYAFSLKTTESYQINEHLHRKDEDLM